MPPTPSSQPIPQRLHSLNEQAIAIIRLGIPLQMGIEVGVSGDETVSRLQAINSQLESEEGDVSVDDLLSRNDFPSRYQSIAKMLLASSDPSPIFESLSKQNPSPNAVERPILRALIEPLIILVLAFLGMIFLCVFVLPHIQSQYQQIWREPTGVTALMLTVRDLLPLWMIGLPLLTIAAFFFLRKPAMGVVLRLLPGSRRYFHWLESAARADRLAAMIQSQPHIPTNESLSDLDKGSLSSLEANTNSNSNSNTKAMANGPIIDRILDESNPSDRANKLHQLSTFYTHLAETRQHNFFTRIPRFAGILVAGMVVLAFALATFLPWIEILSNLTHRRSF